MATRKAPDIILPVGAKEGWDTQVMDDHQGSLRSVAESHILLESLRQSRRNWIYHTFPKFSSRARASPSKGSPDQTCHFLGRCDMEIGPHTFGETSFYEVHYLPSNVTRRDLASSSALSSTQTNGMELTTCRLNTSHLAPPIPSSVSGQMISKVIGAASTNPALATLLRQYIQTGSVTPEEGRQLGEMVCSAFASDDPEAVHLPPLPAPSQVTNGSLPVKPFDLVITFKEAPDDRWRLPREAAVLDWKNDKDASLTLAIPEANPIAHSSTPITEASPETKKQVVSIFLENIPPDVAVKLNRWIGGEEKMKENRAILKALERPKRLYLGYNLPEGNKKLKEVQAVAQPYPMRTLKQGPTAPRPSRQKKVVQPPKSPSIAPVPPVPTSPSPTHASPSNPPLALTPLAQQQSGPLPATLAPAHTQNLHEASGSTEPQNEPSGATQAIREPFGSTVAPAPNPYSTMWGIPMSYQNTNAYYIPPQAPPQSPKRKREPTPKVTKRPKPSYPPPPEIHCLICNAKGVPLILGGRFCRPCVESGEANKHPAYTIAPYQPPLPQPYINPIVSKPMTTPAFPISSNTVPPNPPDRTTPPGPSNTYPR
ncbi:hypothetical protein D9611_005687 [Ephemerocybe angulata]|uniref:Uncharacterized protein n=1 Tax=Ephemerocybe angulata TaxID=980116 RepID=A0A8H5F4H7_9AGAR|nr:hypothetical protein D9611_005687 [Tulosesus angulatus]